MLAVWIIVAIIVILIIIFIAIYNGLVRSAQPGQERLGADRCPAEKAT